MDASLEGKVVLVTGGAQGLGAAICRELAAQGASLVVVDRSDNAEKAAAEFARGEARAVGVRGDVGDERDAALFLLAKAALPGAEAAGRRHRQHPRRRLRSARGRTRRPTTRASGACSASRNALHAELRPRGVRVKAIVTGGMRTPFLLDRFPDLHPARLQDPADVVRTVRFALTQPRESCIAELTVVPLTESSWP